MSFFHASKAFDTWHSYVLTRKHVLAENNVLGCELIGNLKDSQWFVINNERLSSRIRLLLFSIFLLTTRMMKCAYSTHKLHHFGRDRSNTGKGIWNSQWSWKIDDIWYERCMMFFNRRKGKMLPLRQIHVSIKNFVGSNYPVKASGCIIESQAEGESRTPWCPKRE